MPQVRREQSPESGPYALQRVSHWLYQLGEAGTVILRQLRIHRRMDSGSGFGKGGQILGGNAPVKGATDEEDKRMPQVWGNRDRKGAGNGFWKRALLLQ